ncbi:MAG: NAD(P)/FAD-dependent oxidoreductase [Gemmatimonadota bacterium]
MPSAKHVLIIGAGPAGLTAGYLLAKKGVAVTILEAHPTLVGGIARTEQYKGFGFDIGGHRFFSKSQEVEDLWTELLPDDMLERPRSSRIYYRGHFFDYPLRAVDALRKLGLIESTLCVLSYMRARLQPVKDPVNLEDWVTNQFGSRLYRIFFKTYTEKVWGMSCRAISADWAAQRIKGLSLASAIVNALKPQPKPESGNRSGIIKTLLTHFRYPRRGPGMLWEAAARKTQELGGTLHMGTEVTGARFDSARDAWTLGFKRSDGSHGEIEGTDVISTAPLRELVLALEPATPAPVQDAARALKYRDFLTVALVVKDRDVFSDNWIYIHDPGVKVGRVQNFKSWSPELVPDPALTCYGLEYFCFEGDGVWSASDAELVGLGISEMTTLGLLRPEDVVDGCVVRQQKAYPVYDATYAHNVKIVSEGLREHFPSLHVIGRNGMHKYNNQDHAMMTAMLTVRNIAEGADYDVWEVNQDAEYHEGDRHQDSANHGASGVRDVPIPIAT